MAKYKFFKKLLPVLLLVYLIALAACNSGTPAAPDDDTRDQGIAGSTLVIYSTFTTNFTEPIIRMFEERYNVTVEILLDDIGPTIARLRMEADNPQADIMWGGNLFSLIPELDLFEDFTSANEPYMAPGQENTEGAITRFITNIGVLMVNTSLLGDIQIYGYACLLNPALSGQIAIADPSATVSSFNHLANQLFAMGNNNPHAGWEYMRQFIINVNGIILPSPDAVHQGVANGEFIVGLTYEDAVIAHITSGAPVKKVYVEEGIIAAPTGVAIVKDAHNREAAEAFIDFVTSYEIQLFVQSNLLKRAVRHDVASTGIFTANASLTWISADTTYILSHRDTWVDNFFELWMAHH